MDKISHYPVESDAPAERPVRQRAPKGASNRKKRRKNLQARASRPKRHMGKLGPGRRSQGGSETFGDVPRGSLQTLLRVLHALGRLLANACSAFFFSLPLVPFPCLTFPPAKANVKVWRVHCSDSEWQCSATHSGVEKVRLLTCLHASSVSSCGICYVSSSSVRVRVIATVLKRVRRGSELGTSTSCCKVPNLCGRKT